MLRNFLCVVALAMVAAPAQAGVYGSAIFTTSNIRVQRSDTLNGTYTDITAADIDLRSSVLDTTNTVTLNGVQIQTDSLFNSLTPPPISNTLQAFITSGSEVAPGENTFTRTVPLPATSAFARADALTTGNLLITNGLNISAVAEIEAADNSLGDALSSTGGTATFRFTPAQEGFYRLQFDSTLDLLTSSVGPPSNRIATAGSSLIIQVNGSESSFDSPIGSLSKSISGTGGTGFLQVSGVTTQGVQLLANVTSTLSITQLATAGVGAAVPEPATVLAFVGIFAAGCVARRRRKRS